jgi:hypothetical protein
VSPPEPRKILYKDIYLRKRGPESVAKRQTDGELKWKRVMCVREEQEERLSSILLLLSQSVTT